MGAEVVREGRGSVTGESLLHFINMRALNVNASVSLWRLSTMIVAQPGAEC